MKSVSVVNENDGHVSDRASNVASFKVMDILARANYLQNVEKRNVLHCEVGQPQSGAPVTVAKAASDALVGPNKQIMGYTDAFGLLELRRKISEHYQSTYSVGVDPDRIVVTTGSSGGFLLAFTACFDVGDVVAVASSGYPCYRNILGALGVEIASVEINNNFKLTASELLLEINRRKEFKLKPISGLILSSPSNPTGSMLSGDELKSLCTLCDEEEVQFISDEIYHGISYDTLKEATALSYSEKTIVINSFSKYYSMSGWRLGWMVIPSFLVKSINSLQQNMFINAPTISQTAALKCWEPETIKELEGHVEKYRKSREIILNALRNISSSVNIAPADGGFYVYVDLGTNIAEGHDAVDMCKALLEEEFVAFTPGIDFEDPTGDVGNRRFRISYAGGTAVAAEAMQRFERFWRGWLDRVKQANLAK